MNLAARITFGAAMALAVPLSAQNVLFVKHEDKYLPVRAVRDGIAQVKIGSRLVPTESLDYMLKKTLFYRDGFIKIDRFLQEREMESGGFNERGAENTVTAQLTSDRTLENCFLVFDLNGAKVKGIAVFELPRLVAGKTQSIQLKVNAGDSLQEGKFQLYVFSELGEHLHSLKRGSHGTETTMTESYFLEKTSQRALTPILRIAPDYPAKLKSKNVDGNATIACRISVTGEVVEASVLEASAPEFGAAALAAAKQWYFVPTVSERKYIETKVSIPFIFPAPDKK